MSDRIRFHLDEPVDPLRAVLDAAPFDDEPVTDDDLAAIREGLEEKAAGEVVPYEEVKRHLREAG